MTGLYIHLSNTSLTLTPSLTKGRIEKSLKSISVLHLTAYQIEDDIILHHLMDFKYYLKDCYVEVYVGRLKREVSVSGDENILYWSDLNNNFFDMSLYGGEGSIGHMIEQVNYVKERLFSDEDSLV